jgi:hypothetical protein
LGDKETLTFETAKTVSVRFAVCVSGVGVVESVALKVRGALVTACDGLPLIAPVEAFKDKPVGSVPTVIDQVYGVVPPAAVSVAE